MFQQLSTFTGNRLPHTVEQVVDLLCQDLSLRDRIVLSRLSEQELESTVYPAIALILRKEFGLYHHNSRLISSCRSLMGTAYDLHEDPAMVIIKELWKQIGRTHHLRLVKG